MGDPQEQDDTPDSLPAEEEETALATSDPIEENGGHKWLHHVLLYSVLAGLCPLSPIPFIDDIVIKQIRKRMVLKLFSLHEIALTSSQVSGIIEEKTSWLLGCCMGLVIYPIKKIFRKIFYFLAVKDCVDVCSDLLHQGMLLEHALAAGHVGPEDFAEGTLGARRLNVAIAATLDKTDTRPLNQLLKRSFSGSQAIVKEAASLFASIFKKKGVTRKKTEGVDDALVDAEEADEGELGGFVDRLTDAVWAKEGYRAELNARFAQALADVDVEELEG